jgi:hypothetical protein
MATELQANIDQWGSIVLSLDNEYLEEYLGVFLGYMSGPLPVSAITKE